jgi:hypothetical protein
MNSLLTPTHLLCVSKRGDTQVSYVQTRVTSGTNIGGQIAHDLRRKIPSYIQQEPEVELMFYRRWEFGDREPHYIYGENMQMIQSLQKQIKNEMQERIRIQEKYYREKHGRAMPRNTNHFFKGVVTFSKEDSSGISTNKKNRNKLDIAMQKYMEMMNETYGTKPLYYVRHEDETTVHYHFVSENFDYEEARTVLRRLVKYEFSKMQDMVGTVFADLGYQRGRSKYDTKAEHKHFLKWREEEAFQSKKIVHETTLMLKKARINISVFETMEKGLKEELLKLLKQLESKQHEITECKEVITHYKEMRKAFLKEHSGEMDDAAVLQLHKIEEKTRNTRVALKSLRGELKELSIQREKILGKPSMQTQKNVKKKPKKLR